MSSKEKFDKLWKKVYGHKPVDWRDNFYYKDKHNRYYTLGATSDKQLVLNRGRWMKVNGTGTNRVTAEYVEDSKVLTAEEVLTFDLAFTKISYDEWSNMFAKDGDRF